MGLAQWCQTHTLKEFLQMMEDVERENTMSEDTKSDGAIYADVSKKLTPSPELDARLEGEAAKLAAMMEQTDKKPAVETAG